MRLLLLIALGLVAVQGQDDQWWQTAVFYQIYPRSFMDSNGDGIGDLQGIISRLDHLKDAGVTAAWLSPIYKSPQVDSGYDISDYRAIQDEYGTMEDFDALIAKANELGIKIIMDMVPNHSSDQHEWFYLSENRTEGYEDYYVWKDGPEGSIQEPPNNWLSVFKYSAWKYSSIREQWYLHQFAVEQPDLNFENPKVVQEILDVLKFWLDKGVYGFRVDAVPHIGESQGFEDEPKSGYPGVAEYEHDYLLHWYTHSMPKSYDVIYQMRAFLDEYNSVRPGQDERIMMTEAYANITATMWWYGDEERDGAHFTFNFQFIPLNQDSTAGDIVDKVNEWLDNMPDGKTANWVVGNHDNHRLASRVHPLNVDGYNMLVHMLPGVAVTFQGEEIAMPNGKVTWEQGHDPSACNGRPEDFDRVSRDFERTPFHWDDTKNAGFSTADETWLPVSEKYHENNLAKQKTEENSHFKIYQSLTAFRKESTTLRQGNLKLTNQHNVLLLTRNLNKDHVVFLFNLGDDSVTVDLNDHFDDIENLNVIISSNYENDRKLASVNNIQLPGHAALIGTSTSQ
ncbi:maltase 1-like [Atheta coriaria]|uniref:maltase 1-like n=1 Tax=Dalotia coriaria TaxID=877792 RepID=UPI0031F44FB2